MATNVWERCFRTTSDLGGFVSRVVVALVTRLDGSMHMWGSYAITFRQSPLSLPFCQGSFTLWVN